MRKALIVGINDYPAAPLFECINDANKIYETLARHHDGSPNFDCARLLSSECAITRAGLRQAVHEFFANEADVALFYFSGHGSFNSLGGYLVTPDASKYDEGVPMGDLLSFANKATNIREVIIILDCCHSGAFGQLSAINDSQAVLREGISVLTASRSSQAAVESSEGGIFTTLVCDALKGGAADICGNVTVAGVYYHIDQTLGAWYQRPLFKAHVSKLVSLRKCEPELDGKILRQIAVYFPTESYNFKLDPSYEPTAKPENKQHEEIFSHLQKYRATRLVVPVGEEHMYDAAMNKKSCKLTPLGKFYWTLVKNGRL